MPPSGKRPGQSLAATGAPGLVPSHLFFITVRTQGLRFLMDTGAEVSVLSPTRTERGRPRECLTLHAANGTSIATHGTRSLTLSLGLRRTFRWVFIVADVEQPILGADFLSHFNLLVALSLGRCSHSTHYSRHSVHSPVPPFSLTLHRTNLLPSSLTSLLSHSYNPSQIRPSTTPPTTSKPLALQSQLALAILHPNV